MTKALSNDVVSLRAPEPEDLECLYSWENDSDQWINGSTLVPFSRFSLRQHIENAGRDIFETKQLRLMIVDVSSNKTVGVIDLFEFEPHHKRAGVGILIAPTFQQKGFATQALNVLKHYVFSVLHLNQLHAVVSCQNLASQKLFQHCSFIQAGVLQKWNYTSVGFEDVIVYQCINEL
jgi:diamine N-acetyltransferase